MRSARLPERAIRRPRAARPGLLPASLLVVVLLALGAPSASGEAQAGAAEPPSPFLYYTGIEVEPVRGRTEVSGARAAVELDAVLQGDRVQHDFLLRNTLPGAMELTNVKACTGCILDGYSRRIQPGGVGRISIVVVTDSVGGSTVQGTVRAATNDPDRPTIEIDVSLEVKEFAALSPYRVWLRGRAGETIVETCTVVPNEDYPFEITGIKTRKGVWFDHAWRPVTRDGRPAWEITLTNKRSKPGSYQDVLYVQTSHPARPELKIRVEGRIEE